MRQARCTYFHLCGAKVNSKPDLAFFSSQVLGTISSTLCACGFYPSAHKGGKFYHPASQACANYEPRGDVGYDEFYCGCKGYD